MIIQTGMRTDIPAFYSEWLCNRIKEGYVMVRNPYQPQQVTRYTFSPSVVDLIAFCSKNPAPMLSHMDLLKTYGMYWFVTITPYGKEIEPLVPDVEAVRHGSQMLEQLDLVVAVVLKPLVEERRVGMIPQEHVGFLEVGDEAENAEEQRGGVAVPLWHHIQLVVKIVPKSDMGANASLGGETVLAQETRLQFGLVERTVLQRPTGHATLRPPQQRALREGVAARQHGVAVEEEHGKDDGVLAGPQLRGEFHHRFVGVDRGPQVHIENLEVRGGDVADAQIS